MHFIRLLLFIALLAFSPSVFPKGSGGHSGARASKCASCARNSKGKIARNPAAVREFKKTHPCPGSCKGMVVDHIVPLKRGGADVSSNMQWQTKDAAKAKDRVE
jgi:hypothetical protein